MKKTIRLLMIPFFVGTISAKTVSTNFNVFREQTMTEFAGNDDRAPLRSISKNGILGYCAAVNAIFSPDPCDGPGFSKALNNPSSVVLVPSENIRANGFNLLLTIEEKGAIFFFDGDPAHMLTVSGFSFANFGKVNLDFGYAAKLRNIVSDYKGGFWLADPGRNRILRLTHAWTGAHSFSIVGELILDNCQLVDLYFTDMKTATLGDNRLYIATGTPSQVLAIDPYFSSTVNLSSLRNTRDLNKSLHGVVSNPEAIYGAYDNDPVSQGDVREIYVAHDGNRLSLIRDYGIEASLKSDASISINASSRMSCIRTNDHGEVYVIDAGNSTIHKYSPTLEYLFSTGKEAVDPNGKELSFLHLRSMAIQGKEIYTAESYSAETGIRRFSNAAVILQSEFIGLDDLGYNPQYAGTTEHPFPKAKIKLSEYAEVKLTVYQLSGTGQKTVIWTKNMGEVPSGWSEAVFDWDGKRSDGTIVNQNVFFSVETHKYFPNGDHSIVKEAVIDLGKPLIDGPGNIAFTTYPSELRPFHISIPFKEKVIGRIKLLRTDGTVADVIEFPGTKPADFKAALTADWNLANLGECEAFFVEVEATDFAGNAAPPVRINGPNGLLPTVSLANYSGGFEALDFSLTPRTISSVSTVPANRFTTIHADVNSGCRVPFYYSMKIFNAPALTGNPVYTLGADTGPGRLEESGSFSKDWQGVNMSGQFVPDGTYYSLVSLESFAGYIASSKDLATFNNAIRVKTTVPQITLTGASTNQTIQVDGATCLFVSGDARISASVSYNPAAIPTEGRIVIDYTLFTTGGTVTTFKDEYPVAEIVGGKISIPRSDSRGRLGGKYLLSAYFFDEAGNSGRLTKPTNVILQGGASVGAFVIDNTLPSLLIDVEENVLTAPKSVKINLFNNTSGFADGKSFTYSYDLSIKSPVGQTTVIKTNAAFPSASLKISDLVPQALITANGAYEISAVLKDNVGRQSEKAAGYVYLNDRPNQVGANLATGTVAGKTYITGALGDPNITTNGQDKPFEKYLLLYKDGADQQPANLDPAAMTAAGWKTGTGPSAGQMLFAPFHRQDAAASAFPFSNASIVPTNLQGLATVGLIDASSLANGPYTLLALSYEKDNAVPRVARSNFTVNNSSQAPSLQFSKFETRAASQETAIAYQVAKAANVHFVVAKYDEASGKYSKKVNEYHFANVPGVTDQAFTWAFDDAFGNQVEDGNYRILAIAEDLSGSAADWKESGSITANTSIQVSNVSVSPSQIVVPPRVDAIVPDENVANVSFLANKHCSARLQVYFAGTLVAETEPKVFNASGVSSVKSIAWDGSGPGNLAYNATQPYELRLMVASLDDPNDKTTIGGLLVKRISPAQAGSKPGIPSAVLSLESPDLYYDAVADRTTAGTSEVVWQTRLSGNTLSGNAAIASGTMGISARQNVSIWKSNSVDNSVHVRVKKKLRRLEQVKVGFTARVILNNGTFHTVNLVHQCSPVVNPDRLYFSSTFFQIEGPWPGSLKPLRAEFTLNSVSSPVGVNDLANFVQVAFSTEIFESTSGGTSIALNGHCTFDETQFAPTVQKELQSSTTAWPDHYHPLDLVEPAFPDFPVEFYNAGAQIEYTYEVLRLPEMGNVEFVDFAFDPADAPPYLGANRIVNVGAKIGNYSIIRWTREGDFDFWSSSDLILHTGDLLDATTPEISKAPEYLPMRQKYLVRIKVRSEAEETLSLHWPFPATGVPASTIDGRNYALLAYKTANNGDPRTDGTNFVNIVGPYRVNPAATILPSGQVAQPYTLSLRPDDVYPLTIGILPDIHPAPLSSVLPNSVNATLLPAGQSWPIGTSMTVSQNTLTVNATQASMPTVPWSTNDDSYLSAYSPLHTIAYRETFSKDGLLLESPPIDIPSRYLSLTAMPAGTGSLSNIGSYPYSFWRRGDGTMTANAAQTNLVYQGLSGGQATLMYVDGSPNNAIQISQFDAVSNAFNLKHAPNATPKRFVEVRGSFANSDGSAFDNVSLDYYSLDSKAWNEFGRIAISPVNPVPDITHGTAAKVLGYWDVTHCHGSYIVKLTVEKNGGTEESFQAIKVGTPVDAPANGMQTVYSPYSKAQILFPAGSAFKGQVSIVPIKPTDIRGIDLDKTKVIPLGPLLEVLPSGLVFDKTALPKVTFTMTADDVTGMGVAANRLGEMNIYYVDEKRGELVPLESSVSRFIMREGSTLPETVSKGVNNTAMAGGDRYFIEGPIEHTSVYGSFSDAVDKLRIESPPALVASATLASLTGTVFGATSVKVYVSPDGILDKTETVHTATITGAAWSVGPLTLNEGKNYLFAVATIGGKETVAQTEVTVDRIAPTLTGTFPSQYVAYNASTPYSFDVFSSEKGSILVKEVGNANALTSEYALIPSGAGGFKATIQILPGAFKDLRTMVELHAVDEAGNGSARQYIEVLIDNEAPTFILTNTDIQRPISGSLKDIHAVDRVLLTVSVQGVQIQKSLPFTGGKSGDFGFTLDLSALPEGDGTLTLEGFDKAQNRTVFGPEPIRNLRSGSLRTDAIAQYLFHPETNSTIQDVSGVGIPLDLSLSGSGVARISGGGIVFPADNHGSIVKSGKVSSKLFDRMTQSNEMAVEFWFKPGNISLANYRRVVELGTETGTNNWNFAAGQIGKNLFFKLRTQSAQWVELKTAGNPLTQAGVLHHVLVTYAPYNPATGAGGMRIYLNKAQVALNQEQGLLSPSGTWPWGKDYALCLGNRPGATSGGWQGDVLMMSVYDRYLDSLQVKNRYEAGIPAGPVTQRVLLGLASAGRVRPAKTAQGYRAWKEDAKFDGGDLAMAGVKYPYGLSGSPASGGNPAWLAYDLKDAADRFAAGRSVLRMAAFGGRQDNAGSVTVRIKTSSSQTAPTDEDWKSETGSVIARMKSSTLQNAPIDLDLDGARWLMLGVDSDSPDNADLATFGSPELILGDRLPASKNGLRFSYYEGSWSQLPDFARLAAVKKGQVESITLSPRQVSDNFGFRFEGFISIDKQGLYNFYLDSDDGSRLYIDERTVVDNDGIHPLCEQAGSVFLSPGYHRFVVDYFDRDGSEGLAVRYSGPDVSKQVIPTAVLFKDSPETPTLASGLTYRYYEGEWANLPDFGALVPIKTGIAANFDLGMKNREDNFGIQFEGYLNMLDAGAFTFHVNSDDGTKLYIDEVLVVSNDGVHPSRERTGSAVLSKGIHRIRVDYFDCTGGQELTVSYEGPGVSLRAIPNEVLTHSAETPKYEKLIALNTTVSGANVPNSVQGFPVLVRLDAANFDFSSARSDGSDIRFRSADGSSLPFEIEFWDAEFKQAAVWVKATVPGNTVTNIRLQWGNPLALGGSSSKDVFGNDNSFIGAWHLGEAGNSAAGGYRDATGKALHATGMNTGAGSESLGLIGFAQNFNGQNQYLRIPQSASGTLNFPEDGAYTISAWVRADVLDDKFHSIVSKGDNQYQLQMNSGKAWEFFESNGGNWESTTAPAGKAKWVHLAGVRNGASQSLYVNGVLADNSINCIPGSSRNSSFEVNFGRNSQNTGIFFDGQIDEVGIANAARSPDWIRLSYENQKPHQSLVAVDPENYGEWRHSRNVYLNTAPSGANVVGTVENFPVLIRLRAENFDFSQAGDLGQDIRFATSEGLQLEYEIERWDAGAKTAEVWVLVPRILGNNPGQSLRMYWGNPGVEDRSCGQNVFSNADNFSTVWHLGENPTGEGQKRILDATYYGNHAISAGNLNAGNLVEGKLGLALKFNGSGNHLRHDMALNRPEGTISAWMRPDQIKNMAAYYESDGSDARYDGFSTGASDMETDLGILNGEWNFTYQNGPYIRKGGGVPQVSRWDHVVFKWDRTACAYLYVNGQQKATVDMRTTAFASKIPSVFKVGEVGSGSPDRYWKGGIDEMRTMSLDMSEDRIRLNYENQKDGQTLVQWTAPSSYVRIKNRWLGTYLHIENRMGKVQEGAINTSWQSAQWSVENSAEGYVRFKNRWTNEYMHIENLTGCVQYGSINPTWGSAKWYIEEFNGFKRIRNEWNGQFIFVDNNVHFARYGNGNDGWALQWTLETVP